ncbi:cobyric acid synthase [Bacillota bacterium LX-D]|nr:cobyric acid synthase [Bacillota bacterium LX-D]
MAKSVMLQGTSSNVGKSVLAAALCRIFKQDGLKVVPFKSQNMALNSFVTKDGGEMGRAQVVQAQAAGLDPAVEMNPVLLKPTGNASSQVIILGKPIGNIGAKDYHMNFNTTALGVIQDCLDKFNEQFDVIVIEGAGSPVEVNLKPRDIANMKIAKMADAPVLLVADIDRGGAIASIVGTLELLDPDERDRVAGIIVNKFRGDIDLLKPAIDFIEEKTGKPVLGVVPYFKDFSIPDEDSVALEEQKSHPTEKQADQLDIVVVRLPRISNFTDFDPLGQELDVNLRYLGEHDVLGKPDLIIIPGSKNTIEDMCYLEETGIATAIKQAVQDGVPVIGICGGFQILGEWLHDPHHTETKRDSKEGLGLLAMETFFEPEKITTLVEAEVYGSGTFLSSCQGQKVTGYEIHMGRTTLKQELHPAFLLKKRGDQVCSEYDGAVSPDGNILGTYLHGIFDNDLFRREVLNILRQKKGWAPYKGALANYIEQREKDYNLLADVVRTSMNMDLLYNIVGLNRGE